MIAKQTGYFCYLY